MARRTPCIASLAPSNSVSSCARPGGSTMRPSASREGPTAVRPPRAGPSPRRDPRPLRPPTGRRSRRSLPRRAAVCRLRNACSSPVLMPLDRAGVVRTRSTTRRADHSWQTTGTLISAGHDDDSRHAVCGSERSGAPCAVHHFTSHPRRPRCRHRHPRARRACPRRSRRPGRHRRSTPGCRARRTRGCAPRRTPGRPSP
jgi:hypothetical protein